jgi:zinc finger-containing ubiquitin peptidase 1
MYFVLLECAALLRYLGVRAQIVDFHIPKPAKGKAADAALSSPLVRWVRDYFDYKHSFLHSPLPPGYFGGSGSGSACVAAEASSNSSSSTRSSSCNSSNSSGSSSSSSRSSSTDSSSSRSSDSNGGKALVVSQQQPPALPPLPPLYFQHQGHSRTIVGENLSHLCVVTILTIVNTNIDHISSVKCNLFAGYEQTGSKFSLLLFDPSSSGSKVRVKLEQMSGWQCMVKRGAHTLTHRQYQIVYVAPGGMLQPGTREYENGKELKSTVFH